MMIRHHIRNDVAYGRMLLRVITFAVLASLGPFLLGCGSPAVQAKPAKIPHVGFLSISASPPFIEALRAGLRERGYVEGQTVLIDWRVTSNKNELPAIAAEFVAQGVDLIIAGGTEAVIAAKAQTTTIPIVMTNSGDAVGTGLVASLARPGGNVTGSTQISPQISGKRVELLKEAIPSLARLGVLWHPDHPTTPRIFREAEAAVADSGLELISLEVRGPSPDFEKVFALAEKNRVDGLLVIRDPLTIKHQQPIVDLAAKYRLPAMYETLNFVEAGGLMLYGPSFTGLYRHAAIFVDKILKGANPAEMPVEHPTSFELVINQKAADAMGLIFPESFRLQATEIIR